MASASVAAEPSCKYGAVAQTPRRDGTSRPVSGALRRVPLDGLSVPMLAKTLSALLVKFVPLWQAAQFCVRKICCPAVASALKPPLLVRPGLVPLVVSDFT